jgi:hypothetical protein
MYWSIILSVKYGCSHFLPSRGLHSSSLATRNALSLANIIDSRSFAVLTNQSLQIEVRVWLRATNASNSIKVRGWTWTIRYAGLAIEVGVVYSCPLVQRFTIKDQLLRSHRVCLIVNVAYCYTFVDVEVENWPWRTFLAL